MREFLVIAVMICLISACKSDNEQDLYSVPDCDSTAMSFESDILPIVNEHCSSCHGGLTPTAGLLLETYDQIKTSANNSTYSGMINRIEREKNDPLLMPMGYKLPQCQIDQIKAWVNQGSLNN